MFGTDLPVWQAHEECSLTRRYRAHAEAFRAMGLEGPADAAFLGVCGGGEGEVKRWWHCLLHIQKKVT